jgi:regulator of CtrA degradation
MDADQSSEETPSVETVFERTYDETLSLLIEARDYLAQNQALAQERGSVAHRLVYAHETLRLTTRLSQVMAWVLAQRAIHAGEIPPEEAHAEDRRLAARELCLADDVKATAMLPPYLQSLSKRAAELYRRIDRLDGLARGPIPMGPSFDFL